MQWTCQQTAFGSVFIVPFQTPETALQGQHKVTDVPVGCSAAQVCPPTAGKSRGGVTARSARLAPLSSTPKAINGGNSFNNPSGCSAIYHRHHFQEALIPYSFLRTISESLTFKPLPAILFHLGHLQKCNFQSWPQQETVSVTFQNTFLTTSQHRFTWLLIGTSFTVTCQKQTKRQIHHLWKCELFKKVRDTTLHSKFQPVVLIPGSPISASWHLSPSHLPAVCGISSALWGAGLNKHQEKQQSP